MLALPSPAHVPQCFLVATGSTTRAMWGILNGRIIDLSTSCLHLSSPDCPTESLVLVLVGLVFIAKFRRYRCPNNPQLVTKIFQDATLHFGLNFRTYICLGDCHAKNRFLPFLFLKTKNKILSDFCDDDNHVLHPSQRHQTILNHVSTRPLVLRTVELEQNSFFF